ncbi:MAG: repair protein RecO protein [Parcubacteria group bacterium GW2011_GWC2_45_7]|nr:MAG: repair protein RecO protein [Parcubacteria group bacterium GW2011_GWC2_45_7]KKU73506.1 MAG: repair protein RecO protein [Parcubacteria group bacterium GW2011_GWA2_47_26]
MTYNTDGIILKYRDIGEYERIYTILTRDHGKIEAWGQGVRKPQSKLSPHLQSLYLCDFMLARGRRFDRVAQVKVKNYFSELWADLQKLSRAVYAAALVDLVLRPGTKEKTIFELFHGTLNLLEQNTGAIEVVFSLKLLKDTGFTPQLHNCVMCKKTVEGISRPFEAVKGGVLCEDCFRQFGAESFPVSSITVDVLEALFGAPLSAPEMPSPVQKELSDIAATMIQAHFGEMPKAQYFMVSLTQELHTPVGV